MKHDPMNLERLPALPAIAARAIAILASGGADALEVERAFRSDEGLAAAALRRANSAFLGGTARRSYNLRESIARLGNRALLRLAIEHAAEAPLAEAGRCFGLVRGALWKSALGGAAVAESLAQGSSIDGDLCFVSALLRDIGKLALDAMSGDERALEWPQAGEVRPFVDIERVRFGEDHAEIGARLAERWSLPTEVCRAVRHHHAPPDDPADPLCDIVHCADCVARWAGLGIGDDGLFHPLSVRARDSLGLTRQRVEFLAAQALAHVRTVLESVESPLFTTPLQKKSA